MFEFTVRRNKWSRGISNNELLIGTLNASSEKIVGNMCCVGFLCLASGLTKKDIKGVGGVGGIKKEKLPPQLEIFLKRENGYNYMSDFAYDVYSINDSSVMNTKIREEKLIKKFAEQDIKINFVD